MWSPLIIWKIKTPLHMVDFWGMGSSHDTSTSLCVANRVAVVHRSAASRSMAVSGWTKWVTSAIWTPTSNGEVRCPWEILLGLTWARVDQLVVLGMGDLPPLMTGILIMGPYKPLLLGWFSHPLLYRNNGSLDPNTLGVFVFLPGYHG